MDAGMPTEFVLHDEQPFATSIHLSDGTFVKSYRVPKAGTGLPQHSHATSHTSYIATGAVRAWKDGRFLRVVTAPDGILIEAHAKHFFETLEDNTTILCIHAVTDGEEPDIEEHHTIGEPWSLRPPVPKRVSLDAFTFQEEDAETWLADAQPLFREHLAATGQDPDGAALKNIPLGRQLASAGALIVMTARSNGRMFAYLLAMISPTLDAPDILTAHLLLPFASPDAPGAGKKLQAAMIDMLRTRGVSQVIARAGLRGDGPRLGAMYRRLGFVDDGALYRLDL